MATPNAFLPAPRGKRRILYVSDPSRIEKYIPHILDGNGIND